MDNVVYVVHCIDTEGPLYESIKATFKRIKDIFGFDLEVSEENLKKLQNKEIDLNGKEDDVYNLVSPKRINTNDTWDKIDEMLDEITSSEFRQRYADSFNNGWIYNWFCMDHVGFTGENPRRKDLGYNNIFDHYKLYMKLNNITQDLIQWHYHPVSIIKDSHRSGTTYLNSSNIYDILTRKVIDRKWFPAAYRPGLNTERPDSHWFLEQWIPFDYGNHAGEKNSKISKQPDVENRFGNWEDAPKNWLPYNPDFYDYQQRGNCNRYITRCLRMESRVVRISQSDIDQAFAEAQEHGASLLAFTNHDWRDMKPMIKRVWEMLQSAENKFTDVKFKFVDAIQGMRKVLDLNNMQAPEFNIKLEKKRNKAVFNVKVKNEIFGVQPFLAIKTKGKQYFWENFDFINENEWSYTFDYNNIEINAIDKLGVAANTNTGVTEVVVLDVETERIERNILNKNF
ncbi:MAG: hypothetical protein ACQEQF_12830 [Bacillota bacterium]